MLYLALLPVLIWLYLALGRGGFWRVGRLLSTDTAAVAVAGRVVAIIPARNEAPVVGLAVQSLLAQQFAGELHIIVVDDASTDGTADVVRAAADQVGAADRVTLLRGSGPDPGWSGKVCAMARGVAAAPVADYLLFTDADIFHDPDNVAHLVGNARRLNTDLLSSMVQLTVSNNGLTYYEQDYINPIAQILTNFEHTNIRVIAVIEPDSLPNLVTNLNDANCAQANSSGAYVNGIQYALNKLHAIPNVYNYVDIAHSAWLGWSSNMGPAVNLFKSVASGTTAGVNSMDGFISDTANTTPITEPYMTATQSINGQPVDSANFYQFNPYIDELTYNEAMYTNLVNAGFPSTIGMLIDTSRNGWGGSSRPTGPSTSTDLNTFVNQSKVDRRPFRGDWCNQNGAGLGPFPQANPNSSFTHLYAYVWIKPPGESDGDYPTATHSHGDPHCDPNGTNTDGNGNTYPTNAIPGFDIPAGQWFPAQFQQLVQNAFPVVP